MKGKIAAMAIVLMFFGMSIFPTVAKAALEEGKTTQGEFALWLVREIGAQSKLPPAATGKDAIDFLTSLGIAPDEGWSEGEPINKEFLVSLLGPDATGTFAELADQVKENAQDSLSDRNLGVFRASGVSPSGSAPAA